MKLYHFLPIVIFLSSCELLKKIPWPEITFPPKKEEPAPVPPPEPEIQSCVNTKSDFTKPGPYQVRTTKIGMVNVYDPVTDGKCKKVISHYSNGTGARCIFYLEVNRHLASHGYLATCYESPQTGSGEPCIRAYSSVKDRSDVLKDRFLSIGHSQGGNASVHCQYKMQERFPGVFTVSAGSQPAWGMGWPQYASQIGRIANPIAVFSGDRDTVVPDSWVRQGVRRMKSEHYYYQCRPGCTHLNSKRWHKSFALVFSNGWLLGDDWARNEFKKMGNGPNWKNMLR